MMECISLPPKLNSKEASIPLKSSERPPFELCSPQTSASSRYIIGTSVSQILIHDSCADVISSVLSNTHSRIISTVKYSLCSRVSCTDQLHEHTYGRPACANNVNSVLKYSFTNLLHATSCMNKRVSYHLYCRILIMLTGVVHRTSSTNKRVSYSTVKYSVGCSRVSCADQLHEQTYGMRVRTMSPKSVSCHL